MANFKKKITVFILLFVFLSFKAYADVVDKVEVKGNQRVSLETIVIFGDIIIGNNYNQSCNRDITSLIKYNFNLYNYSLEENNPYPGGYLTKSLGNPKNGINVIQIDINRSLYMDERSLIKNISNMNILSENLYLIIQNIFKSIMKFN